MTCRYYSIITRKQRREDTREKQTDNKQQMLLSSSKRMYSPGSPTFSSLDRSSAITAAAAAAANAAATIHQHSSPSSTASHNFPHFSGASLSDGTCDGFNTSIGGGASTQCVKFKYFATFIVCTTCLALLSASLATHKWIVSRPIRVLRLNGNLTSLMLTVQQDGQQQQQTNNDRYRYPSALLLSLNGGANNDQPSITYHNHHQLASISSSQQQQQAQQKPDTKFQGEIYFGLFKGVKVLNHGFGDRYIPISGESVGRSSLKVSKSL